MVRFAQIANPSSSRCMPNTRRVTRRGPPRITVRPTARPRSKSARQLDHEVAEVLASPGGGDDDGMERVTRERVLEPLVDERVTARKQVEVVLVAGVGPEPWDLIFTTGRTPPYGVVRGGRILVGPMLAPLAGLAYAIEHGRPYVHHFWVDPEARGRGLSRLLFDAYRSEVSPRLVVVGPFTRAGRAAAERSGAVVEE